MLRRRVSQLKSIISESNATVNGKIDNIKAKIRDRTNELTSSQRDQKDELDAVKLDVSTQFTEVKTMLKDILDRLGEENNECPDFPTGVQSSEATPMTTDGKPIFVCIPNPINKEKENPNRTTKTHQRGDVYTKKTCKR